jgi:hypothetical protein
VEGTADPSAPLRSGQDDKLRADSFSWRWLRAESFLHLRSVEGTADPSAPLRSGQDDKLRADGFSWRWLGAESFLHLLPV